MCIRLSMKDIAVSCAFGDTRSVSLRGAANMQQVSALVLLFKQTTVRAKLEAFADKRLEGAACLEVQDWSAHFRKGVLMRDLEESAFSMRQPECFINQMFFPNGALEIRIDCSGVRAV